MKNIGKPCAGKPQARFDEGGQGETCSLLYPPGPPKEGAELLFQVLAERHERGSVVITTNLGFADWTQVFGDPNMTAALLDRLTHRAHIIECSWDSYRLKQSLKGGTPPAKHHSKKN